MESERGKEKRESETEISWVLKDLPLSDQGLRNSLPAQIWTENFPLRSLVDLLRSVSQQSPGTVHTAGPRGRYRDAVLPGDSRQMQRSQYWETLAEALHLCDPHTVVLTAHGVLQSCPLSTLAPEMAMPGHYGG